MLSPKPIHKLLNISIVHHIYYTKGDRTYNKTEIKK